MIKRFKDQEKKKEVAAELGMDPAAAVADYDESSDSSSSDSDDSSSSDSSSDDKASKQKAKKQQSKAAAVPAKGAELKGKKGKGKADAAPVKTALGKRKQADSSSSDSDSDSDSSDEEDAKKQAAPAKKAKTEAAQEEEEDSSSSTSSGSGSGRDSSDSDDEDDADADKAELPPMSAGKALIDPIWIQPDSPFSKDFQRRSCILCPKKPLKTEKAVNLHITSKAHARAVKRFTPYAKKIVGEEKMDYYGKGMVDPRHLVAEIEAKRDRLREIAAKEKEARKMAIRKGKKEIVAHHRDIRKRTIAGKITPEEIEKMTKAEKRAVQKGKNRLAKIERLKKKAAAREEKAAKKAKAAEERKRLRAERLANGGEQAPQQITA